jgi:hypothetical protein
MPLPEVYQLFDESISGHTPDELETFVDSAIVLFEEAQEMELSDWVPRYLTHHFLNSKEHPNEKQELASAIYVSRKISEALEKKQKTGMDQRDRQP